MGVEGIPKEYMWPHVENTKTMIAQSRKIYMKPLDIQVEEQQIK